METVHYRTMLLNMVESQMIQSPVIKLLTQEQTDRQTDKRHESDVYILLTMLKIIFKERTIYCQKENRTKRQRTPRFLLPKLLCQRRLRHLLYFNHFVHQVTGKDKFSVASSPSLSLPAVLFRTLQELKLNFCCLPSRVRL